MKHKGLSFYHSVWFRPGRIKTNYLIKSHEWWLGPGSCLNISVRPKSRHWRNNPNIIGSQCSHDTIERDDMKEIHSQAQVLRGYILPICVTVVWRDHCATRGTFLITDKGAPFMGWYTWLQANPNLSWKPFWTLWPIFTKLLKFPVLAGKCGPNW